MAEADTVPVAVVAEVTKADDLSAMNESGTTIPFGGQHYDDESVLSTPKHPNQNLEVSQSCVISPQDVSERVKALAPTLQSIPELTLDEASHVRSTFISIMGEKENITNTLELRILLGDLGFYPPERELNLLLQAYRSRLNLSGLIRFLRFYKKDYPTSEITVAPRETDVFSQMSSKGARARDPDAVRAWLSLGGEEDCSGFIRNARLREALEEFGVVVSLSEEMEEREEIDFTDFCGLWEPPAGQLQQQQQHQEGGFVPVDLEKSYCSFSVLNPVSRTQSLIYGRSSLIPRRLLSAMGRGMSSHANSISQLAPMSGVSSARKPQTGSTISKEDDRHSRPRSPVPPTAAALRTDPISEEERAQLLCMYLFPERYESRRTRFTLPDRKKTSIANAKTMPVHRMGGRDSSIGRRRRPKKRMLGWRTSSYNQKRDEESDEDDFITQKNGGMYRPPSPMILSLRNSTAYKKHQRQQEAKRLQEIKQQQQLEAKQQQQQQLQNLSFNGTNTSGFNGTNLSADQIQMRSIS